MSDQTERRWIDDLLAVEDLCWAETHVPPPGRSVPIAMAHTDSDEERLANWLHWKRVNGVITRVTGDGMEIVIPSDVQARITERSTR